ncbi:phosphotransferase [Curtobacterium poinsettiae]|uniref:phosphotransferase n=1 Tax=Curtobacterium poinsettiae TaxID=159612 RepID=UPI0021C57874|nr:phosphotransferase [Curtobacterium flaccumfaciens]MCU0115974.1 phosphotransferase [Curtobacterium flaccumfaciens]
MEKDQTWELVLAAVVVDETRDVVTEAGRSTETWASAIAVELGALGVEVAVASTRDLPGSAQVSVARMPEGTVWEHSEVEGREGSVSHRGVLIAPDRSLVGRWSWSARVPDVEVVTTVQDALLAHWAAGCGLGIACVSDRYRPGADSALIARVETDGGAFVAKVGPTDIVSSEVAFMSRVGDELGKGPSLFPTIAGMIVDPPVAVVFMDAARPATLDEALFADDDRTELNAESDTIIAPFIEALASLHETTDAPGEPFVAKYVYQERFETIPQHPGFEQAARRAFPETNLDTLLANPWIGPDGERLRGLHELVPMLRRTAAIMPVRNSIVHGDPHLKNLLQNESGEPVFIDPRTVWDGNRRPDEGRGDPAYDFATLFHSVWPMSAVLRAVETGSDRTPFHAFDVQDGTVRFQGAPPDSERISALEDRLVKRIASIGELDLDVARARLLIGAANALIGWLRYPEALPSRNSWGSTMVGTLWFLERGLGALDRNTSNKESVHA